MHISQVYWAVYPAYHSAECERCKQGQTSHPARKCQGLTQLQIRSSCLTAATMFEAVRGMPHVSTMPVHSYKVEMIYLLIAPTTERTQSSINNKTQHPVAHSTRPSSQYSTTAQLIVASTDTMDASPVHCRDRALVWHDRRAISSLLDLQLPERICFSWHSTRPFLQNTTSGFQHEWLRIFRDLNINVARSLARLCYCLFFYALKHTPKTISARVNFSHKTCKPSSIRF